MRWGLSRRSLSPLGGCSCSWLRVSTVSLVPLQAPPHLGAPHPLSAPHAELRCAGQRPPPGHTAEALPVIWELPRVSCFQLHFWVLCLPLSRCITDSVRVHTLEISSRADAGNMLSRECAGSVRTCRTVWLWDSGWKWFPWEFFALSIQPLGLL